MIKIKVENNVVSVQEKEALYSGAAQVYTCEFSFGTDWERFAKSAVFRVGSKAITMLIGEDNCCVLPWELLVRANIGSEIMVGVYGVSAERSIMTSVWDSIGMVRRGSEPGDDARNPTDGIYEQIMAYLKNSGDELSGGTEELKTLIQRAETAASLAVAASKQAPIIGTNGTWWIGGTDTGINATGPEGMGIAKIEQTGGNGSPGTTDTYTITMTDGTEFDFTVYNGADGAGGSGTGGDMTASVYDPQGKQTDVFQYVDDAVDGISVGGGSVDGCIIAERGIERGKFPAAVSAESAVYENGVIYAANPSGTGVYVSSDNGDTWESKNMPLTVDFIFAEEYPFFALLTKGSNDVQWWDAGTNTLNNTVLPIPCGDYAYGCYANSVMLLSTVDSNGVGRLFNVGTVNAEELTPPFTSDYGYSLAYGNGMFVAVEFFGKKVATSTDNGSTWTTVTLPNDITQLGYVKFFDGRFYVFPYNLFDSVGVYSDDGINWNSMTLPSGYLYCNAAYGNGVLVVSSEAGVVFYSEDKGATWNQATVDGAVFTGDILKGLKEQGCNGPVTEALGKLEKHLNKQAHRWEEL